MSRRTKANKAWVKIAHGTFRRKEWKNTLPSYYQETTTASKCGRVYTHLQPANKSIKYSTYFHEDMAAYFGRFFPGLFL